MIVAQNPPNIEDFLIFVAVKEIFIYSFRFLSLKAHFSKYNQCIISRQSPREEGDAGEHTRPLNFSNASSSYLA